MKEIGKTLALIFTICLFVFLLIMTFLAFGDGITNERVGNALAVVLPMFLGAVMYPFIDDVRRGS